MAGKKGKTASRKIKDKWKAKEWYKVYAPRMFNDIEIGETPSADPEFLLGRTTEVTVHDLTGDFSRMHVKLKFRVDEVEGSDARTVFIGHDLTSDYVRRLTRRKRTKTDFIMDVRTKDGYLIRIKPMSIAERRIQSSQESAIRAIMSREIQEKASDMTVSELVKSVISGDMAKMLARSCRIIVPIKRIEIRRTEILEMGDRQTQSILEVPVKDTPEPVEAPVEVSEAVEESEVAETEDSVGESEEIKIEEKSEIIEDSDIKE